MLLVVLGHIGVNDNFGSSYLFKWIYAFHMPLFFWISGFLFNGGSCFRKFLSKKAKRLLVPLVVLTSIVYYPKVLLSDFAVRRADGSFFGFISSFIYPETNPIQLLWFLNVLFGTYVLAWIIDNVIKSKSTGWLLGGALTLGLYYILPDVKILGISKILYHFPFFAIGVLSRKYYEPLLPTLRKYNTPILVLSFIALSFIVNFSVCRYFPALIGIIFSISIIGYITMQNIPFFPQLRPYTFSIYLLQWFPLVAVRILFYNMLGWNIYLCYVMMFFAGLLIPVMICKVCLKFIPATGLGKFIRLSVGLS